MFSPSNQLAVFNSLETICIIAFKYIIKRSTLPFCFKINVPALLTVYHFLCDLVSNWHNRIFETEALVLKDNA